MKIFLAVLLVAVTAVAADAQTKVRQSDIDRGHVTVLGITVGVTGMAGVEKRLGRIGSFNYGTSGKLARAVCYVSKDPADATTLLFVPGPEGRGSKVAQVRITAGDVKVDYVRWCLSSGAISKGVATEGGLRLGMTPAEVKSVLGDPTDESAGFLGYEFHLQRKLTEKEVRSIEVEWPKVRLYPYQDISSSVEARFSGGVLKRLDLIRFSTY